MNAMQNLAQSFSLNPFLFQDRNFTQFPQTPHQFHALYLKSGTLNHPSLSSRLLSLYTDPKINDLKSALSLFDALPQPSLLSWNLIIKCCVQNHRSNDAVALFRRMVLHGVVPDGFTLPCVIKGCARLVAVHEGKQVHGLGLKIGFGSDKFVQSSLVSMYAKWGEMGVAREVKVHLANQLFSQMPVRSLISWNSMIAGFELNGWYVEALELFDALLKEGLMPSNVTILSALSAVSSLTVLSNGRWIHSFMVKHGFELDGVLGTSLIAMYSKCGSIESAMKVFEAIANKKLGHWTAIIVGLGMHGLADQSLELFQRMRRIGMKPHDITFIGVLNACSHAGLVDDGSRIFHMMIDEYKIKPTVEHYGCYVDILCRAGHLEQAKMIIESMPMRPNKVIWMSLLGGSRNHGNLEIGEYAAHNLIEADPDFTGCYTVLSNMYAAAGKWDKVSQVREMMKKRRVSKDVGCSFIEHRGQLHRFIVGDRSHPQSEDIYAKLKEMREKLKQAGHVPDTSQVLLNIEGEKEKESELENHSERLAISFGLINMEGTTPIRIIKNLRVCNDCHEVTKLLSVIYHREIVVRDNSRFHHFKNGSCSCNDFW
ncbi:hypothetical protein Ahy_A07g031074 [Arachis hypogaea]|uniref:DYW domain-containing protein n=1 Tax=Arachis hypogaea TaxID=3818 RepID=A0A445C2S9_ARAHY|nr:hypothetical protein Ahy_A07g031074 [Arachis hypogaea]